MPYISDIIVLSAKLRRSFSHLFKKTRELQKKEVTGSFTTQQEQEKETKTAD